MEKIKVKDKEFALYISRAEIEKQIDTTAAVLVSRVFVCST